MVVSTSLASRSFAEVIRRILDKDGVVDAFLPIALVGINWISIEAVMGFACVETYLGHAEAVGLTIDPFAEAA